jgi:hypothetical protein
MEAIAGQGLRTAPHVAGVAALFGDIGYLSVGDNLF